MDEDYNMESQQKALGRIASFNNVFEQQNTGSNVFKIDVDECEDVCMDEPQSQLSQSQQRQQQQQSVVTIASQQHPPNTLTIATDVNPSAHRYPSPVPTEPEDPDPEYISDQLEKQNIKIRDYGLYPPYTITSSLPLPLATTTTTDTITQPATPIHPTSTTAITINSSNTPNIHVPLPPETFDPYKALGEFEYRLRQTPRTLPIPGKTTRRLLEIGWISESEVSKRCSGEDLQSLADFDERNRVRGLKLGLLSEEGKQEQEKDGGDGDDGDVNGWGFNKNGSYPYITLRSTHIPSYTERDELVTSVRPLFLTVDRVVRMAMAAERERERDRLEAEEALRKAREVIQQKEEAERVERQMIVEEAQRKAEEVEEIKRAEARKNVRAWPIATTVPTTTAAATTITGPTTTTSLSPGSIRVPPRSRKRSPHQAWAEDDDYDNPSAPYDNYIDDEDDSIEAKRLRLARSQSETWYEQERRLQQQQQQPSTSATLPPDNAGVSSQQPQQPFYPQLQPNKPDVVSSQTLTHSRSRSQPTNTFPFQPPIKQYPAPLSAYDPHLYPDAASVIESQSQSQSQQHNQGGGDAPPALSESSQQQDPDGRWTAGVGKGIGITVGEDGEEIEDTRPNALKRSPKKGLKRGLTRGRTLVQIC